MERVLKIMKQMKIEHNIHSYIPAVIALAGNGNPWKAQNFLEKAMEYYHDLDADIKTQCDFNATIMQTAVVKALVRKNNFTKALQLFEGLKYKYEETSDPSLKPDIVLYATVINALSRRGEPRDVSKACELLDELMIKYRNGDNDMMPNKYCFTPIIVALSKSSDSDSFSKAEEMISQMEMLSEKSGDPNIMPDQVSYSLLLKILSRSNGPKDIKKAKSIMDTMYQKFASIDALTYSIFLNILANTWEPNKGEIAEEILNEMEGKAARGYLHSKPDERAYTAGKSRSSINFEHHFQTHALFCLAIKCLARSDTPNKAKRSWVIVNRMLEQFRSGDLNAKPTPRTLSVGFEEQIVAGTMFFTFADSKIVTIFVKYPESPC